MCDISNKIEVLVKNKKDAEILLLLTKLIDDRFNAISKGQQSIEAKIEDINNTLDNVIKVEKDVSVLKKKIDNMSAVQFFCLHPKLGIIFLVFLILGVIMSYFYGIDNLLKIMIP